MSIALAVRMMRAAISPRLAISNFEIGRTGVSHPEHAVATAALDDVRVNGRQDQAEHRSGIARIDDAVVEKARRDEEGMGLRFDLSLDGCPPPLISFFVERPTGCHRRLTSDDR